MAARNVLIFGASYGALFGLKLAAAGHRVTLVCRERNAALINEKGVIVRFPVKGREGLVEVRSRELPGRVAAATPERVNPASFDLVVLGMQEPQYRLPGVRELLEATARSEVPCLSIMNMPPPPCLARIPGVNPAECTECYTDAGPWAHFDARRVTLCSPDPQAFRPPEEEGNVLQVRLPTNFKAAAFEFGRDTALLRELAEGIEAARALANGVPHIERVDRLVQAVAAQRGLSHPSIDETVARVDDWLVRNRLKG